MALRNLLKLPKAHKWVCYEFFYSNIDRALFEGETDFMVCIRESFPLLKTRRLTRVEWCKIRRLMGKPRRCSQVRMSSSTMTTGWSIWSDSWVGLTSILFVPPLAWFCLG